MATCRRCGTEFTSRYCGQCGEPPPSNLDPRICPRCESPHTQRVPALVAERTSVAPGSTVPQSQTAIAAMLSAPPEPQPQQVYEPPKDWFEWRWANAPNGAPAQRRENRRFKRDRPLLMAEWQQACEFWGRLMYCHNCNSIYRPGGIDVYEVNSRQQMLNLCYYHGLKSIPDPLRSPDRRPVDVRPYVLAGVAIVAFALISGYGGALLFPLFLLVIGGCIALARHGWRQWFE